MGEHAVPDPNPKDNMSATALVKNHPPRRRGRRFWVKVPVVRF